MLVPARAHSPSLLLSSRFRSMNGCSFSGSLSSSSSVCAFSAGAELNRFCPSSSLSACSRHAVSKGRKVCSSVESARFARLWYTCPSSRLIQTCLINQSLINASFLPTVTPYLKPELLYSGELEKSSASQQFQHGWKATNVVQIQLITYLHLKHFFF